MKSIALLVAALPMSAVALSQEVPPPRPSAERATVFAQQQRADELFAKGKHGSALRIYQGLVDRAPSAVLHYKLGLCHKMAGSGKLALACARDAIKLQPSLLPALALAIEFVEDAEEATSLAGLISDHPMVDAGSFEKTVIALQRVGQPDLAIAVAQKGMRRHPDHAPLHYTTAELALAGKRLPLAESCYAALAKSNPRDPRALESLGRVQLFQGKKTEARSTYERTLKVNPSNLAVRRELIDLMVAAGEKPEAVSLQRRYLDYYQRVHAANAAKEEKQ